MASLSKFSRPRLLCGSEFLCGSPMADVWMRVFWREMIQPSGQTDPFDVDRTVELREENRGVGVHRQRDEQGGLEQA